MTIQFIECKVWDKPQTRIHTAVVRVVVQIGTRWKEEGVRIDDEAVQKYSDDRKIVKKQTPTLLLHQAIVEDENVSFHGCPSDEKGLNGIEVLIDELPDETESGRTDPDLSQTELIEFPWIHSEFGDQSNDNDNNEDMIV